MAYSHDVEHSIRSKISICFGTGGVLLLPLGALGTKFGLWNHNFGIIVVMLGFLSALVPGRPVFWLRLACRIPQRAPRPVTGYGPGHVAVVRGHIHVRQQQRYANHPRHLDRHQPTS